MYTFIQQGCIKLIKSESKEDISVFPTGFCDTCGGRWRQILICIFMTSLRQVCVKTICGGFGYINIL